MKTVTYVFLLALFAAGCSSQKKETAKPSDTSAQTLAQDDQLYTAAARNLVAQYGRDLQSTLLAALNDYGPSYGVRICQTRAQEIAAAYSISGWEVKRVSEKWRNVLDRPDTAELRVLTVFADPMTSDDYLVRWSGPDSARMFHYYQKITVRQVCLQCHGDLQTVDLDLFKQVKVAYPWDKATGYKEGDLRGMFVVNAPYPEGREIAQLLADGATAADLAPPVDSSEVDSTAADTTSQE
jgi:hypothetical protein